MRTDPKQSDENREEAELEEALKLWMEIRQVDRKKGWERLEAEIGRQYGLRRQERRRRLGYFRWLAAAVILCFGIGGLLWLQSVRKPQTELLADWDKQPRLILENGEQILLGGEQEVKPEEENRNFVIDRRKKNIVYTDRQGGEQKKWQYNTLEVPRGAEYELIWQMEHMCG
ncbi:MAG: hypothetical protein ACLU30_14980 [Odoribacter splanchnicus]